MIKKSLKPQERGGQQKIVLYIATSLDGFIAGPHDDISWLFRYNDVDYGYKEFFATIGAVIEGKRTYDIEVKNGWENAHPVPTFVLTHKKQKKEQKRHDVEFTSDEIGEVIKKAKNITDKNIWLIGGANAAQQFLREGLLDEIIIAIVPIILGKGIRLFDKIPTTIDLTLKELKQYEKGLVQMTYHREKTTKIEKMSL